ncbi:Ger(x)C family spore germination protein [Neobacillus sp. NPDC097160]|uniref:Ger(x)C family spore germination protein n=1 Tax=Neobacillus sp. NPDC097160 TaxID=3364298 RepID=UPI003828491F
MMRKIFVIPLLVVLLLPILSACWNQKELTDLAFVMAMGIDKGEHKKFDVSFQIVNPGNVSSGQNGGGQGLPIAVYKSSGDTLTEAARKATKKISRRLYYAHTNLIVVSEEVARNGLLDIIDALDRDPEFRTTTELVVMRGGSAELLVSALANLDKMPVNKITKEIKATEAMFGENMSINIDYFLEGLVSKGKEPIVNGFKITGNKDMVGAANELQHTRTEAVIAADGLAIFKKGKLVGWITREKARGVIWILDRIKSTAVNIDWNGKKDAITMALLRSKTKVSVKIKNEKPVIHIAIEDEGWISEANTNVDLMNPTEIEKIDRLIEKEIKRQILATVKEAQKMKADILGFGESVHRKDPKLWNKLKENWGDHFANLEVTVEVNSFTRREGIRTKPFWSDFNK